MMKKLIIIFLSITNFTMAQFVDPRESFYFQISCDSVEHTVNQIKLSPQIDGALLGTDGGLHKAQSKDGFIDISIDSNTINLPIFSIGHDKHGYICLGTYYGDFRISDDSTSNDYRTVCKTHDESVIYDFFHSPISDGTLWGRTSRGKIFRYHYNRGEPDSVDVLAPVETSSDELTRSFLISEQSYLWLGNSRRLIVEDINSLGRPIAFTDIDQVYFLREISGEIYAGGVKENETCLYKVSLSSSESEIDSDKHEKDRQVVIVLDTLFSKGPFMYSNPREKDAGQIIKQGTLIGMGVDSSSTIWVCTTTGLAYKKLGTDCWEVVHLADEKDGIAAFEFDSYRNRIWIANKLGTVTCIEYFELLARFDDIIFSLKEVSFQDSTKAFKALSELGDYLNRNPHISVIIKGHAYLRRDRTITLKDSTLANELSQNRADFVRKQLLKSLKNNKTNELRVKAVGVGVSENKEFSDKKNNARIEIIFRSE